MEPKITSFSQIKAILEPVPAEKFQAHCYGLSPGIFEAKNKGPVDNGCSCALGHIHRHFMPEDGSARGDKGGFGARELSRRFLEDKYGINRDIADVNNGVDINGYTRPEIKDRVMAFVEDGIRWEEEKAASN